MSKLHSAVWEGRKKLSGSFKEKVRTKTQRQASLTLFKPSAFGTLTHHNFSVGIVKIDNSHIRFPTFRTTHIIMAPKKRVERPQENVSLGPQVRDGEEVFGVARIFASFVRLTRIFSFGENHAD